MATPVIMPKLGNSVESSQILAWHKAVGDTVQRGELLCEIETDKATMEVNAPESGRLLQIYYPEGAEVAVMTAIAVIGVNGEAIPDFTVAPAVLDTPAQPVAPILQTFAAPEPAPRAIPASQNGFASPRARKIAFERGLSLDSVQGSGPNQRILERDLPLTQINLEPVTSLNPYPDAVATPLRGIRAKIAIRMQQSLHSTAQLSLHSSADATALQAYYQRLKLLPDAPKVTLSHLVLLVVARTLRHFPNINALLEQNVLYEFGRVNLGFAVAGQRGLTVPVIQDAARLSLRELVLEAQRLITGAQTGSSSPSDLQGGTFTVSNLGAFGVEQFTPILNPPQVAILGVGSISLKPVQQDSGVVFVAHLGLSLTIDHQVIDGLPAAQFLQALSSTFANLELLLL